MTSKEKAYYIDHFLKELKDASFASSLANILELKESPSKENKDRFKLLEYEMEKHELVELVRGRNNSTLDGQCMYFISGKGLEYVLGDKSTIDLFEDSPQKINMTVEERLSNLDELASEYQDELSKGSSAAVNSHKFINIFSNWYLDSRDLFADYFDNSDISFREYIDTDTRGNGFTQSSHFRRLYPLYNRLKKKILEGTFNRLSLSVQTSNKGFIIHGHNDSIKFEVARLVEKELSKEAIILHEMPNKGKTVIEKFESYSDVDFAIALWTSDDLGKAKDHKEMRGRARQNVIFETGYFIGKLGRNRVIILYESGVEMPSDYNGIVYISLSSDWKYELIKEVNSIYK